VFLNQMFVKLIVFLCIFFRNKQKLLSGEVDLRDVNDLLTINSVNRVLFVTIAAFLLIYLYHKVV
jgi:hypothetical protein